MTSAVFKTPRKEEFLKRMTPDRNPPRIGINMDIMEDEKGLSYFLRTRYTRAIVEAGGRPVLIPPLPEADPEESLRDLHGLLMTGGDDLSPHLYGYKERHEEEVPLHPQREAFDMKLVLSAMKMKIPLLAICLGLQELCVAHDGGLHPFIPHAVPEAMEHRSLQSALTLHRLEVEPGTRLHKILGPNPKVMSAHRQAVSLAGEGLIVAARTRDDIIEAVEGSGDHFVLGVQWHPELMPRDPAQKGIFSALIEAAEARAEVG